MLIPAAVLLACFLFIVYILAGYPLLLGVLAKKHDQTPPGECEHPSRTVSILLPVRNGEKWISRKLASIAALNYPKELIELIVISDGSTDATESLVSRCPWARLIVLPSKSKMAALNAGLAQARSEIIFFTDVRQELDPESLRKIVARFDDPRVASVSGELMFRSEEDPTRSTVSLYWNYEKWIRLRQSRIDSMIGATGCIFAMRRDLTVQLPEDLLLDDVYLPLQAFLRGYRTIMVEDAIAWDSPAGLDTEFRRKVRTLAGNYQLMALIPELLTPRNRMLFHFLSHKAGRLLLPFALIGLFVAPFFLSGRLAVACITPQVAFYALALFGGRMAGPAGVRRVASLARTFTILMAATLCAATILFRPASSFWKTPTNPLVLRPDPGGKSR